MLLDMNKAASSVGICAAAPESPGIALGADADLLQHRVCNVADPAAAQDAATKAYVDACIQALAARIGGES